jgi:hypothetical protein
MGDRTEESHPAVPDELVGPTPRKVRLSDNTRRVAFLVPLGFIIVFYISVRIGRTEIPQLRNRLALRTDTRLAVAQIASLHSGGRGVEIVEYVFNGSGKQATGTSTVPWDFFQTMRDSRQIIVRYRPSDPSINHPDAWEWSPGAEGFFGYFALLCGWFVGIIGIVYLIRVVRRRMLIRYGLPALAIIQSSTRDGRIFSYRYIFRSDDGVERFGKDSTVRELEIGARSWALYFPNNSGRNCLYPAAEFKICS